MFVEHSESTAKCEDIHFNILIKAPKPNLELETLISSSMKPSP